MIIRKGDAPDEAADTAVDAEQPDDLDAETAAGAACVEADDLAVLSARVARRAGACRAGAEPALARQPDLRAQYA